MNSVNFKIDKSESTEKIMSFIDEQLDSIQENW
jgi:hypothetical protein